MNKKARPVVILGAIVAGLTFMIDSLQALFKDNPTMVLILSIIGIVVAGVSIMKDRFVEAQVTPVDDVIQYVDQQGNAVAGPASPLPDGTLVDPSITGAVGEGGDV